MPEPEAGQQETYGNAPGWSPNQVAKDAEGMPVAQEGASPAPDAETAPSAAPAQEQVSEQVTPPPEPEKYNVPPKERWDEVIRRAQEAERQRDDALRLAQAVAERGTPQPAQPQTDPWEPLVNHPDPATAQYWQTQRKLAEYERQRAKQEALQELAPVIDAGRAEIARLNIREFRKENPDIKPGSADEASIVAYMNGQVDGVRHPLDSARRNALFDRLEAENRALKGKQASVPRKVAAAQTESSSGIPAGSGLPAKQGDWRERVSGILDKGGGFREAANAIFGGR